MVAHDHLQHGRSAESEQPGSFAQMLDVYCSQALASLAVLTVAVLCCIAAFLLVGSRSGNGHDVIFILAILALYPNSRRVGKWIERNCNWLTKSGLRFDITMPPARSKAWEAGLCLPCSALELRFRLCTRAARKSVLALLAGRR